MNNRQHKSIFWRASRALVVPALFAAGIGVSACSSSPAAATYSVSDVTSSVQDPSVLLVGFDVTNKGGVTGTPSCSINAASLPSQNMPMQPVTSGQVLDRPGCCLPGPQWSSQRDKRNGDVQRQGQADHPATGKASYTVTNIAISRMGVNKTVLNVNFQVLNTGMAAGTPHCEASFRNASQWYKAGAPQPVDLKAFGDALYMKQLDPGVIEFVKGFALVVSNAQSATASDVTVLSLSQSLSTGKKGNQWRRCQQNRNCRRPDPEA